MNPIGVLLIAGSSTFFAFLFTPSEDHIRSWTIAIMLFSAAMLFWALTTSA